MEAADPRLCVVKVVVPSMMKVVQEDPERGHEVQHKHAANKMEQVSTSTGQQATNSRTDQHTDKLVDIHPRCFVQHCPTLLPAKSWANHGHTSLKSTSTSAL